MPKSPLNRRTFLRSGAVCIGLPLLDAMLPSGLGAEKKADELRAKRILLIGRPLGLHTPYLFPDKAGKEYQPSRYLQLLAEHRQHFTVFSGLSHLGYPGSHHTEAGMFTGVGPEGMRAADDIRNTISLEQEVASKVGGATRHASLVCGHGGLSWNRRGVQVPSDGYPKGLFKRLFIDGTPAEVAQELSRIRTGKSILDGVREQANTLSKSLSPSDRVRVDAMLASVREAEQQLQQEEAWVRKPKPKLPADAAAPFANEAQRLLDRTKQLFALAQLALQTDSTRAISMNIWSHADPLEIPGVQLTHHDASHHGQDEGKLKQLEIVEASELKLFASLLGSMKASTEGGVSLLDQTVIVHCSNLGNASSHDTSNLPVILAGGGFKHAGHVAFDRKKNKPLSNLFVRVLQQLGIQAERFGSSTGVLTEV